jgi:hypothetical protein
MWLNQPASANPAACCGVSERNKIRYFPYWEDSLQLAAGSFNLKIVSGPLSGVCFFSNRQRATDNMQQAQHGFFISSLYFA